MLLLLLACLPAVQCIRNFTAALTPARLDSLVKLADDETRELDAKIVGLTQLYVESNNQVKWQKRLDRPSLLFFHGQLMMVRQLMLLKNERGSKLLLVGKTENANIVLSNTVVTTGDDAASSTLA